MPVTRNSFLTDPQVPFRNPGWLMNKEARVVPTPDGVWHKDSHYRRKFMGGGAQVDDFNKGKLEEFLRNFFGEEIGGVRCTLTP